MPCAKVREICAAFAVESIEIVSQAFAAELERALRGQNSSLSILPSFLTSPSGEEQGEYIAIDFGGTNVRVMRVSLLGDGRYTTGRKVARPLADLAQGYDLTTPDTTGEELFDFIAALVKRITDAENDYALGLTFSYPMQQKAIDKAVLIEWTKEIKTSATVGRDIKSLLGQALRKQGLHRIEPVAIINDTVAALMAGAYSHSEVCMGSICGTGHNTCYLESSLHTLHGHPMIINTEAGNFSSVRVNSYDRHLDQNSLDPGKQRLEKMTSGKYIGELFRLILLDLMDQSLLPKAFQESSIWHPLSVDARILSSLRGHGLTERRYLQQWLNERGLSVYGASEQNLLAVIAEAILGRASGLIAASFLAILRRNKGVHSDLAVAIDGSIFEKVTGFSADIELFLNQGIKGSVVRLIHTADGSNIGAAVAAAQTTAMG